MTTFLQWNCRGYYSNFEELVQLINICTPKCICLQELRLCHRDFFQPSEYKSPLTSIERGDNDRGGAGILIHKSIPYSPVPLQTKLHAVAARIHLFIDITICSIYLAPSSEFTKVDLADLFKQLPAPVVILGDFNLRHPLWGDSVTSSKSKILIDLLTPFSLGCLNTGLSTYERLDTHTSCIDISFCSHSLMDRFTRSRFDYLFGSDHYPIALNELVPSPMQKPNSSWRYDQAEWAPFYQATAIPLSPFNKRFPTVDDAFCFFQKVVISAAEACIPQSSSGRRSATPWWSQECAQANREKKKLYRQYKKTRTTPNMIIFKAAAARSRRINRQTRKQYFRNYISTVNSTTPLPLVWKVTQKISRRSNNSSPTVLRYGPDITDTISTPAVVADALGYSFASHSSSFRYTEAFQKLRTDTALPDFSTAKGEDHTYNRLFTLAEYQTALANSKDGALGLDMISYIMLRHIHPSASAFLLDLYNRIWIESSFPSIWTTAFVIPIPKPGKDLKLADNRRPISLTCHTCKLMEKMVSGRFLPVLESRQAFSNFQFGFRKNRSTADPLLKLDHDIREAFSTGGMVLGVFFDLEKAYDTTWRTGILLKLHSLGFRGQLPLFIKCLLSNRSMQVRCSSILSRHFTLDEGVPQGSVLSVLLFALGFNDIVTSIPATVNFSLYVDDLALYIAGARLPFLERQLQLAIENISQWASSHGFHFSPTKTSAALFRIKGSRIICHLPPVNLTYMVQTFL